MAVSVSNEFDINAPASVVMEVLRDIPSLPDWSSAHSSAEVLTTHDDGTPDRVRIAVGMLGINDTQELAYTWTENTCSWTLLESSQLSEQRGTYTVTSTGADSAHVVFELTVDLKIKLPGFLVKKGQNAAADTAKKGLTAEAEKRAAA
ncbi:MAG: SRPBCC family protein [Gordonia sp. (in: high G+C Gram-positive bacteria)]|uniref:SRPBCC family protein n=1 Tax=Gordonia sp. (in: high G+C Gram-positive bacteria) TaxID=84139 RepID=UPI0039E5E91F